MRTDVGTADKAMVRRVVVALANSVYALTFAEIVASSSARPIEAREALSELISDGLVTCENDLFALASTLNNVDRWAEASGAKAFNNRRSGRRPEWLFSENRSRALTLVRNLESQGSIANEDAAALLKSVVFKLSIAADQLDPLGRVPLGGIRRPKGPVSTRQINRRVIFALADQHLALTAPEIRNLVPWRLGDEDLTRMVGDGILLLAIVNGTHLYALSPNLGGATIFAESVGSSAFDRRELSGDPHLLDNGGPGPEVPLGRQFADEGRLASPWLLELERLLAVDIAFFRYEIERSRSWRRGLRYRDFRMSPRFRRAIGALPTRREILHRLLQAIARILPVPPPPRRTVLDVFAEDVGEAELVLDNLLIAVGPPPDWRPMLSGEDRSVNE